MIFRRSRAEASVRAELAAAHTDRFGRAPSRLLAAARGESGWCFLLTECLAYEQRGEWRFVRWHEIEQGSWNDQNHELRWEEVGGRRGSVLLEQPGRVPEVFKERVQASIVLHRQVPIEGTTEGGVVSARRDLSDRHAPLQWRIRRGRGTEDSPENWALLEAALTELRTDFDI
jgi:hypothetical protein